MAEPIYETLINRGADASAGAVDPDTVLEGEGLVSELEVCAHLVAGTRGDEYVALADFTRERIARALRTASAALQQSHLRARSRGAEMITSGRLRQIDVHGYAPEGDRGRARELLRAAESYLEVGQIGPEGWQDRDGRYLPPGGWPWGAGAYHPSDDQLKNLQTAGALLAAGMDSLLLDRPAAAGSRRRTARFT